jgi:hypothetical protein
MFLETSDRRSVHVVGGWQDRDERQGRKRGALPLARMKIAERTISESW